MKSPYSGQAIGILGTSYSGSTVLNYLFDTHTHIYGGSELIRLVSGKHEPYCAVCGKSCRYWTPQNLTRTYVGGRSRLYSNTASIFGKPIICDSSKQIRHFIQIMEEDRETTFTFIALSKHPIRHIASFVTNDLFRRLEIKSEDEIAYLQSSNPNEILQFALTTAQRLLAFYDYLDKLELSALKQSSVFRVKYESVVSDPASVLQPVLDRLGLSYQAKMTDFSDVEHHPIGGNMGPHAQTAARHKADFRWGEVAEYRKKFYDRAQNLALDDKYQQTFLHEQIAKIEQMEPVQRLFVRLGYSQLS
jgi:hypothetical protein